MISDKHIKNKIINGSRYSKIISEEMTTIISLKPLHSCKTPEEVIETSININL